MAMDSYSQALQSRRGKSLDGSIMHAGAEGEMDPGGRGSTESPTFGGPKTEHSEEHIPVMREGEQREAVNGGAVEHVDDHRPVVNQHLPPAHVDADAEAEMREHIIGHVSPGEHEMLAGMKPRSLGERVKMAAMEKSK